MKKREFIGAILAAATPVWPTLAWARHAGRSALDPSSAAAWGARLGAQFGLAGGGGASLRLVALEPAVAPAGLEQFLLRFESDARKDLGGLRRLVDSGGHGQDVHLQAGAAPGRWLAVFNRRA